LIIGKTGAADVAAGTLGGMLAALICRLGANANWNCSLNRF
jgi:hypothetical protein